MRLATSPTDWVTAVPTQHKAKTGHGADIAEVGQKIKNEIITAKERLQRHGWSILNPLIPIAFSVGKRADPRHLSALTVYRCAIGSASFIAWVILRPCPGAAKALGVAATSLAPFRRPVLTVSRRCLKTEVANRGPRGDGTRDGA